VEVFDQQVEMARGVIKELNESIVALNERVASVLNGVCNARIRSEPEDGRRSLARTLGSDYKPSTDVPVPGTSYYRSPAFVGPHANGLESYALGFGFCNL
jgi:hypothetical protein